MTTPSRARIRVEVARATLVSERWVMFLAEGQVHALIVDVRDVDGDLLGVTVLREEGDHLVVELPRAAIAGRQVKMPREAVFEAPAGLPGCARLGLLMLIVVMGAVVMFCVARLLA